MQHRFAYVGADLQDLYGINPRTIGLATTLQDPYFQGAGAATMLRRLAARPDAVLVSAETVNDFQLSPGDLLRLRLQDGRTHAYRTIDFHYAGIVNEFPTAPKDSFLVANATYVARHTHSDAVGAFLVSTGGTNVSSVATDLRNRLGTSAKVETIQDARGLVGSSLTSVDLAGLTRIELAFALMIAAAAGGLVIGLGLDERRRSIAVATVIGATRSQLRALDVGEPLFILGCGVSGGVAIGWAVSYLLVKVLTGVFDPPPTSLALPWGYVLTLISALVVATCAASTYVASTTRRNARRYLREL
jgi:putative ABC transport system permease protein